MTRHIIALCLLVGLHSASATASADAPPALTPDTDFQPIVPADWVRDGAVKVFLPIEDHQGIDEAAQLGATILHAGGPSPYYPLLRDDSHSGIPAEERARLQAGIARAQSHHMHVLLGVTPMAPIPIVRQHTDWMIHYTSDPAYRKHADEDLTRPEAFQYRQLGLNTPYGAYLIECLAEMMKDLNIDGYSFDGNYHPAINYSPYEKELYRKETGREVPPNADLNSVDYRLYLLWADEKLEQWYRHLHQRLRAVNPQAAVYTWTTNAGRYGHFLTNPRVMSARLNALFDAPVQEWWLDEVNLGASVVPLFGAAYVRAVSAGGVGACEPYIMTRGNPYCSESFPAHELLTRCLGAMTNGAFTPLAQMAGKKATHQTLSEIHRRQRWITRTKPLPWAALLVSEQSRQFYGYANVMERWLAHALGVYRVGFEEHLAITLINDWDLRPERLKPFRVLILPNAACLSDAQVKVIREYVGDGGGLVATCETSLCDEIGRPRHDFALKDLFGVSYLGRPKAPETRPALDANFAIAVDDRYWANRSGIAAFRWGGSDIQTDALISDPRLGELILNVQATFKGPLVKVTEPAAPMKKAITMFPDAGAEQIPAAAAGEFGKGRVVYLAAGLDAANYSYGFPYQRVLLSRAIQWAAGQPFAIRVQAPMCVQATFWEQADATGRRVIIQLFNGLNTTSDHGLPEVDVPLREESVPISGVQIRLTGLPIQRFHLEPEGQELKPGHAGEELVVDIPPLAVHAIVVGELPSPPNAQ